MAQTATFVIKDPLVGSTTGTTAWQVSVYSANAANADVVTTTFNSNTDPVTVTLDTPAFALQQTGGWRLYISNNEYISFRSNNQTSKYPSTGFSFDIWSPALASALSSNLTWSQLITQLQAQTYSISSDKWTVFYDYNQPAALAWAKGRPAGATKLGAT